jgi:uncharacterized protein YndB with AHSA1/START domain
MARTSVVEASAWTRAAPEAASRAITAPENLPRWFKGAHDVEAEGYPAVGGVLRWRVAWGRRTWRFGGKVIENDLPRRLVVRVATQRSRGLTIHRFEPEGTGTRYTKRVESEGNWLDLALSQLFLRPSVRREVAAAVRLADEEASA